VQYEEALYHVMPRGNERRAIFFDDQVRQVFLEILGELRVDLQTTTGDGNEAV